MRDDSMSEVLNINKDWLQRKVTRLEAEEKHLVYDARLGSKGVPFGLIYDRWEMLVAHMIAGDELWEFRSHKGTWRRRSGREGIALVRNGLVVDAIVTLMN